MSEGGFTMACKYDDMSDESIVELSRSGEPAATEYLLSKYKNLVLSKTKTYFLAGADRDDMLQEGMIGLFKAIRDFDSDKNVSFASFAELCVKRQVISAVKASTRRKHMPLNSYISLSKPSFDDNSEQTLIDTISEYMTLSPEDVMLKKEQMQTLDLRLDAELSSLEKQVLKLYLDGCSYAQIAKALGRTVKSVDNALGRIKKKMGK